MKQQEESERAIARDTARQRVLTDFEKTQAVGRNAIVSAAGGSSKGMSGEGERGVKRKFEMDGDQVEKLVAESEERALKQLEVEQVRRDCSLMCFGSCVHILWHRLKQERANCHLFGCLL